MKKIELFKKILKNFARKIKRNQQKQNTIIEEDKQIQEQDQEEDPLETQQNISKLLELGYTETEVIRIIKNRRFQTPNQNKQDQNSFSDLTTQNLPEKMQKEIQNYEQVNELISQYKQSDNYLLKKNKNKEDLLYEELLEQIVDGVSLMDNESFQKAQDLAQKKPFDRKDLIKIEKQRQLKLEQRAEIELVKQKLYDESNFELQNKEDVQYDFVEDQEQDFKEDEVEPMEKDDFEFQNDWVKQIQDPQLTSQEKASMENAYMEEFDLTRQQAKQIIKDEFFQRKKLEEKLKIRENSDNLRKRHKMIKKLFNTMQKRSLEKLDYENDEGYLKEKELKSGLIHENSIQFEEGMRQLKERISSNKKEVIYDKWEIAKKRYSENVRLIIEDAILQNKFDISKNCMDYQIQVEDIIISDNAHFIYVLWDFLDNKINQQDNINKQKEKISVNLNRENYELETKIFFELHLRKKPNLVFIHSDKNQQIHIYKQEYIKEEIKEQLDQMKIKNPQKYKKLIDSGNYSRYIDDLINQMDMLIGNQFNDLFLSQSEMKKKEKKIKQQLQKGKNIKKDKKNRHIHLSQKQKKSRENKAAKFWNKISTNQISNILNPGTVLTRLKQILFSLGEIS